MPAGVNAAVTAAAAANASLEKFMPDLRQQQ
jgi:hypothetical protein